MKALGDSHTAYDVMREYMIIGAELDGKYQIPMLDRYTGHPGEDSAPREHQCEHFCTDRQRAERAEHRPAAGHFAGGSGRTGEGYLYPGCLRRPYCREIHRCQAQGMA